MIAISPIDFRAGLNKLGAVAEAVFEKNPRNDGIFVFRNKRGTDIKIIFYHRNGFFMGHKRLSKGKLKWWPRTEKESLDITAPELEKLLMGVDPRGSFHPDWQKMKFDELSSNEPERPRHYDQPRRPYWSKDSDQGEQPRW